MPPQERLLLKVTPMALFVAVVMNCSFPYTYNGGLYYLCIENMTGVSTTEHPLACINVNATPTVCNAPGEL